MSDLRILEIGEHSLFKRAWPDQTDFIFTVPLSRIRTACAGWPKPGAGTSCVTTPPIPALRLRRRNSAAAFAR